MSDSAYDLNAPMEKILERRRDKARLALELRCSRIAQVALEIGVKANADEVDEAIILFRKLRQESSPLIAELRLFKTM